MADQTVSVEVIGKINDLTGKLDKLGNEFEKFSKEATTETKKVKSGLGDIFKGTLMSGGILMGMNALIGGLGRLKGEIKEWVTLAETQQRAEKNIEQTIRSTGGAAGLTATELKNMASELQNVTRVGDETIMRGQGLLLTFTGIGKEVFPQATETMLDMSEKMGTDVQSAATMLGKALNDPVMGLSALSRVGVVFTEQQKEQIKTLSAQGDTLAAQKIILHELQVEYGGFARAMAETPEGKLTQLSNRFGDFKETLGVAVQNLQQAALPALHALVGTLETIMPAVAPIIATLADGLAPVLMDLANVAGQILGPAAQLLTDLFAAFSPLIQTVVGLITKLSPVLGKLASIVSRLLVALTPVIEQIATYVDQYADILVEYLNLFLTVIEVLLPVIEALAPILADAMRVGTQFVMQVLEPVREGIKWIIDNAGKAASLIKSIFGGDEEESAPKPKSKEQQIDPTEALVAERMKQEAAKANETKIDPKAAKKAAKEAQKYAEERLKAEHEIARAQAEFRHASNSELLQLDMEFLLREKEMQEEYGASRADLLKYDTEIEKLRLQIKTASAEEAEAIEAERIARESAAARRAAEDAATDFENASTATMTHLEQQRELAVLYGATREQLAVIDARIAEEELRAIEEKYNAEVELLELETSELRTKIEQANAINDKVEAMRLETELMEKQGDIKRLQERREIERQREIDAENHKRRKQDAQAELNHYEEKRQYFERNFVAPVTDGFRAFIETIDDMQMSGRDRLMLIWDSIKQGAISFIAEIASEWLKQQIMSALFGAQIAAQNAAVMSTIAATAAPAASMVSLATMGANAAPAQAGIVSTTALAQGLSKFAFAEGAILSRPMFFGVAGEAGEEIISPLGKLVGLIREAIVPQQQQRLPGAFDRKQETLGKMDVRVRPDAIAPAVKRATVKQEAAQI